MYRDGVGTSQDLTKAIDYFLDGARKGNFLCYLELGLLFLDQGHTTSAKKYFDMFCSSYNDAPATANKMLAALGGVLKEDDIKRLELERWDGDCPGLLIDYIEKGIRNGLTLDTVKLQAFKAPLVTESKKLFERAEISASSIARLEELGEFTELPPETRQHMSEHYARVETLTLIGSLFDDASDRTEALELFTQAVKLGSPKAYRYLGEMYRDGSGVTQNPIKAVEYFLEGVKKGNFLCNLELARIGLDHDKPSLVTDCFTFFWKTYDEAKCRKLEKYPSECVTLLFNYIVWALQKGFDLDNTQRQLRLFKEEIIATGERNIAELDGELPVHHIGLVEVRNPSRDPNLIQLVRTMYTNAMGFVMSL